MALSRQYFDIRLVLFATALVICPWQLSAGEVSVAVASNFSRTIKVIAERFEADSPHRISLAFGATGKHYAQILNGAPFDVFFAADTLRPERLGAAGAAVASSRFTYAIGRIVLWSPQPGYVDAAGAVLGHGDFHHLAIANPRLAPYGRAAEEVLQSLGHWDRLQSRLVRGENIAQAYQFVVSKNAELGFVSYAQIKQSPQSGSVWLVPQSLYSPIRQQAVLLTDNPGARDFLRFVRDAQARQIIRDHGYDTP